MSGAEMRSRRLAIAAGLALAAAAAPHLDAQQPTPKGAHRALA